MYVSVLMVSVFCVGVCVCVVFLYCWCLGSCLCRLFVSGLVFLFVCLSCSCVYGVEFVWV